MRLAVALAVLAATLTAGCATGTSGIGSPDTQGVAALLTRLERADCAGDLAGVLACYDADAQLLPPDGSLAAGTDAIRARYEPLFRDFALRVEIVAEEMRVRDHVAIIRGHTIVERTSRATGERLGSRDGFEMVMRKPSQGWVVQTLAWWPAPGR